jgi:Tol biopolymer transport system component
MWTAPVQGGWPTQITLTKEGVIGGQWSPKSDWIAFMVGNGDRQLYVVRGDGSEQKSFPIQVALSDWTPDGKQIMFASSFEGKTKTDNTYLLNPDSGELQHAGKNTDQISDVSQDHQHALLCHWVDNHDTNLWLYDVQSGKQSLITPQTGAMYSGAGMNRSRPHFSADGKNV